MGVEEDFRGVVERAVSALIGAGDLPPEARGVPFTVERPKRAEHGDLATNVAMTLTKLARKPPLDLAALLHARLVLDPLVLLAEVAKPGFLNVRIGPSAFHAVLADTARAGAGFGRAGAGTGQRILLEFVSANPTGPLLISHARGALLGDALARLLEAAGHHVSREYYVNDFGNQVRTFALSVASVAFGEPLPEDGYPGYYVTAVADYLRTHLPSVLEAHRADRKSDEALSELARQCITRMIDGIPGSAELPGIKSTLRSLGVAFDSWFSEESLHRWGRVGAALERLRVAGFVHELPDGALVFRMPEGEGRKDQEHVEGAVGGRVVRKSDGKTFTYFASDIAYHADKVDRGYDRLIDVLGADHHGYEARIFNVMTALGLPVERVEIVLFQLVSLIREGKPYRMGKRLGNLITVDEVLEEIDEALGKGAGGDAIRYFYLSRRTDSPVELDVELAKKASLDNPAIYLQYGHARLSSLLRNARDTLGLDVPAYSPALVARLTHPLELSLMQRIGSFPRIVAQAARELAPSVVIAFLEGVAAEFHGYWTQTWQARDPVLPPKPLRAQADWQASWDMEKTRARLFFISELRGVYASGLALVGIQAPERMVRAALAAPEDDDDTGASPGDG